MYQSMQYESVALSSHKSLPSDHGISFPRLQAMLLFACGLVIATMALPGMAAAQTGGVFQVTNIISDGYVPATTMDPNFIDPWGVAGGNTLWIDTNVTGYSYITSVTGALGTFKAVVPPASGTGAGQPTGTVQNTTTGFLLSNGAKASFLFATLDGTISGWNSGTSAGGNHALIAVNNSANNAVYPDLALVTNTTGTFLLVPNFGAGGKVEIYNTSFQPATLAGTFTDPNAPAGYAPYGIKVLGTQVFVTYMLRTTPPFAAGAGTYQEILGTNTGFVSVFDVNGNFVARAVTGGNLNAPWGVAIAPAGFGIYGGDLLIGNFGDGLITAYNPTTYAYLGTLADGTGKAIAYPGLWEIFASTASAAVPNSIYFTAGIAGETHGLFGVISNSTTASSAATFNLSTSSQVATVAVGGSTSLVLSVAPANSFSGQVTFSCSGLPAGATCNFSNNPLSITATAPATTTLTLATTNSSGGGYGMLRGPDPRFGLGFEVASALLLPFGSVLAWRRRKPAVLLRIVGLAAILLGSSGLIAGCGSSAMGTPAGTQNVTINATSGSITQSTVVAMTVQ